MTDDQGSTAPASFEAALAELEKIVAALEAGELGLAEGLARYEAGVKLLKQCFALLERAERRIELLSGVDAQGNPVTEPFDDEATLSLEEKGESRGRRRSKPAGKPGRRAKPAGDTADDDMDEAGGLF